MRDFFKEYSYDQRPVLVCGKGPSYRVPTEADYAEYNVVSLNHVIRESHCHIGHIIDIDVLDQLGEKLITNCDYLLMPYYPHIGWRPNGFITLDDLCKKHPILSRMSDRVFGYNLSTASQMLNLKWNDGPIVWASFFSAEAVVNLLGKLGVKRIRTLGVDGGKGRAEQFSDLQNVNTNGYDGEWNGIRKSIGRYSLDYAPLGVESPIRIFIGAGQQQLVPAIVLKHSILKRVTASCDVIIMNEWTHPMPKDAKNLPRTPFSFQRFMIPEKCNYQGHAIYMDSDMLVFGDVKEIWIAPYDSLPILTMRDKDTDKHRVRYSVMKLNCSGLHWNIAELVGRLDSGLLSYEGFLFDGNDLVTGKSFNPDWNSLEEYTEGKTKLLHYTEMYNQPWLANPNHPLGYLWFNELKEAVADGSIDRRLIEEHVANRWILPKCLEALNG